MEYNIYTDGACSQAGQSEGPGGWGVYIEERNLEFYGSDNPTTNNQMELTAFMRALNFVVGNAGMTFNIYSDSAYIVNCFKQKWYVNWEKNGWRNSKKQPVKNRALWESILSLKRRAESQGKNINIIKVKAHSYIIGNNKADALAVRGREEAKV